MISLSATRAFKAYHFEAPHNLSKNEKTYRQLGKRKIPIRLITQYWLSLY